METIKNYLETMFRNLPNTQQVLKAKQELLQMMEDKYTELIQNGVSENEAVGTVISEFGNLDELADEIGLKGILNNQKDTIKRRPVSFDEIQNFIKSKRQAAILRGLSCFFFITCVTPAIVARNGKWGVTLLFAFIALGIAFSIICGSVNENWKFLKNDPCSVSDQTIEYAENEKKEIQYTIQHYARTRHNFMCFMPSSGVDCFRNKTGFYFTCLSVYQHRNWSFYAHLFQKNDERL